MAAQRTTRQKTKATEAIPEPVVEQPQEVPPTETPQEEPENLNEKVMNLMSLVQGLVKELKSVETELKTIKTIYNKELKQKKKKRVRSNVSPNGFVKPCSVSKEMSDFLGLKAGEQISRPQVTKMISAYIKENKLQDPENGSYFRADAKLEKLLGKPIHLLVSRNPEKGNGYSYFNLSKYLKERNHFVSA
jgi:chromatin remodeling complex protein RSC6